LAQLFMRGKHFAKTNESSHNRDVYLNGARTAEYAGKHRYALLRENIRRIADGLPARGLRFQTGTANSAAPLVKVET